MKERLQKLMLTEKITPARFAEVIGVQRSSISHMLSGRNKPSYDVIHSILAKFPNINSEWLLMGSGDMYKRAVQASLFDQKPTENKDKSIEKQVEKPEIETVEVMKDEKQEIKAPEVSINAKEVERVVVFYKDKTFSEYLPE